MDGHRGGGCFAVAAEESDVDGHVGVVALHDERVVVVVVASFDGGYQFRHQMSGYGSVLVLVAAGADGDVEPVEVGSVIDRDPVVADVVEVDDALLLVRDSEAGDPPAGTQPSLLSALSESAESELGVIGDHIHAAIPSLASPSDLTATTLGTADPVYTRPV